MNEISLILPYPVSANRYWRTRVIRGVAMTYVSAEAKSYKSQVAWAAKAAGVRNPIDGRVEVLFRLFPKRPQDWVKRAQKDPQQWDDSVACIDVDNAQKVLLDALKGVVFGDDKFVRKITGERLEPDGEARIEVIVRKIVLPESKQGRLI